MIIWKPLTKFRYSKERNEFKYHTDFALKEGESIEKSYEELIKIFQEKVPKGKIQKIHFEMAVEEFPIDDNLEKLLTQLKGKVKYSL